MHWRTVVWGALVLAYAAARATLPDAQLSHEGIYINLPATSSLRIYMEPAELELENATVSISALRTRSADQVELCKQGQLRSIEACSATDLFTKHEFTPVFTIQHEDLQPDQGVSLSHLWASANGSLAALVHPEPHGVLRSVIIKLRTNSRHGVRTRFWWLGNLVPERGLWPIAASDVASRDGQPVNGSALDIPWDGRAVRISGTMQDPFLPRSRQRAYMRDSSWARGVTIRTRTGGDPVPLYSPTNGTVVWSAPYVHVRPPHTGAHAGENNEEDWCVMIQDAWGTVFQLFGLQRGHAAVRVGERVRAGQNIGIAHQTQLSQMPPSTEAPADPPKSYEIQRFLPYPYRFRRLEVRVGRTSCIRPGDACFAPDAPWDYYPPQFVLRKRDEPSAIPPMVEPHRIYFAPAAASPLDHVPLAAPKSALAHPLPLSGRVDVLSTLVSFESTPGHLDDAMDPLALYALEWAVVPQSAQPVCEQTNVYWRKSFEHNRLPNPNNANLDDPAFLQAHYVPTVVVASVAGHAFRAQIKSQFDEKERALVYALSRTRGGRPHIEGAWDITREPTRGVHQVAIRAWDMSGNAVCTETTVLLTDVVTPRPNLWQSREWHTAVLDSALLGLPQAAATLLMGVAQLLWVLL